MKFLGSQKDTIFIGQAVEVPGTAMSNTLKNLPKNKLLELPVAEEMQMGMTLGLAMDENIPVSIFPRWNFLLYGMNQLINHLDKFNVMMGKEKNIKTEFGNLKITRECFGLYKDSVLNIIALYDFKLKFFL